jgi:hypothetical protein
MRHWSSGQRLALPSPDLALLARPRRGRCERQLAPKAGHARIGGRTAEFACRQMIASGILRDCEELLTGAGPMMLEWLQWSNPVAVWWAFLLVVSSANIALWLLLHFQLRKSPLERRWTVLRIELMVILCAAYVFGCAFRSVLPRADVQRICLFDTWLSSVLVGRSVATIAEICFVVQWAIVLRQLGRLTGSDTARNVGTLIVPMIFVAEACSWFAVTTTNYLGNTIENSIWAVTFTLIAIALLRLFKEFRGFVQLAIGTAVAGILAYVTFLVAIDVPMYFARWQADMAAGKELLGLGAGLYDLSTRWEVTRDIAHWKDEIPWMSLYFSAAVWSSLALCSFGLIKDRLHRYCANSRFARTTHGPFLGRVAPIHSRPR